MAASNKFQCREKGHSKFQNIKHTKAANDNEYAALCSRYFFRIGIAIRENDMISDPKYNSALAKMIREAKAQGVLNTTIEKAIKNAKTTTGVEAEFEVRGPGRVAIIVEMMGKTKGDCEAKLRGVCHKNRGAIEKGIFNIFDKKGLVTAEKPDDVDLDKAEEDAIEFGAEEVEIEGKQILFICHPSSFSNVAEAVAGKYKVIFSGIKFIPNVYAENLTRPDMAMAKGLIDALDKHEMINAVHHNLVMKI